LQVIRTLDPKQNQGAAPEIQALKNQLQERDRLFHSLEVGHCSVQKNTKVFDSLFSESLVVIFTILSMDLGN
jgi:hypothetical protein